MNCIEITSEKQLLQTGLFPNQKKLRWYLLLHFIDKRGEPAGCWALREDLFTVGMDCSTATIGRYLKELDYQDYTVQNSNLGRVVTPSGKAYLRDMDERLERALYLMDKRHIRAVYSEGRRVLVRGGGDQE